MVSPDGLLELARAAQANSYAPFSGFPVGAALATRDGTMFSGCNVENVSFPVGTCAEQAAIAAMIAAGHRAIAILVVVGPGKTPISPCGACRQRVREFADATTLVYVADQGGIAGHFTIDALLPQAFIAPLVRLENSR